MWFSHTRLCARFQAAVIFRMSCGPQNFQEEIVYFTETQFAVEIIAFHGKTILNNHRAIFDPYVLATFSPKSCLVCS